MSLHEGGEGTVSSRLSSRSLSLRPSILRVVHLHLISLSDDQTYLDLFLSR